MRLLLTRAAADAARTGASLRAAGHDVVVAPVIEMMATLSPWPPGVVDGVVASSAQAFMRLGAFPMSETRRVIPLWLVGDRTATLARRVGFDGAMVVAGDATDLIALVPTARRPSRWIYLAGEDRKPDLEMGLATRGIGVETLVVYRARAARDLAPVARQALEEGTIDAVLHFSRRSAALFCKLVPDPVLRGLSHVVLSDDVAGPLRESGCTAIRVAEAPTEAALLALVGSVGIS